MPAKAGKKKKLIIAAAAILVLLMGAGAGAFMFLGGKKDAKTEAAGAEAPAEGGEGKDAFVDVPPMTVNLRSPDGVARFLRVHFMLVPGTLKAEQLKEKLPVLLDAYQPFLRELRPEDLAGSAAVFRVKEEMLTRATGALGPGAVKDVLIQDLVQQ